METRCPICHQPTPPPTTNPTAPFCSARCRLVDLGGWLEGGYRIAGAEEDDRSSPRGDDEG